MLDDRVGEVMIEMIINGMVSYLFRFLYIKDEYIFLL